MQEIISHWDCEGKQHQVGHVLGPWNKRNIAGCIASDAELEFHNNEGIPPGDM